jgi:hypothetical protein
MEQQLTAVCESDVDYHGRHCGKEARTEIGAQFPSIVRREAWEDEGGLEGRNFGELCEDIRK